MDYFDYENAAREAGLDRDQLERICTLVRREFPHDEMMCELHVLRACMAIRDGLITFEDAMLMTPAGSPGK